MKSRQGQTVERSKDWISQAKKENKNFIKIYLFGSLAEKRTTITNDADISIVIKNSKERFIDRSKRFYDYFDNFEFPVDMSCYTKEEFNRLSILKNKKLIDMSE